MEALSIYKAMSQPPKSALREIAGGKLKGKTDINPQWRYEIMTAQFGLCGFGWKYTIDKTWNEQGANGEVIILAQVSVYVKVDGEWSDPITGVGGNTIVTTERGSLASNDEGLKMAVTDAFSTALKMIGVAADIYAGRWDGSKYAASQTETKPKALPAITADKAVDLASRIANSTSADSLVKMMQDIKKQYVISDELNKAAYARLEEFKKRDKVVA